MSVATLGSPIEHGLITHDGPDGQPVYQNELQVSFKECASLSRNIYYTHYIAWIGKIRELPMKDVASHLIDDILTGEWGMVTNSTSLQIYGEATSYDTVVARAWVGNVKGSSFDTHLEFSLRQPNGTLKPLAFGTVRATWVRLVSYGVPSPRPFPPYFQEYMDFFAPKRVVLPNAERSTPFSKLDLGEEIYKQAPGPSRAKPLHTETFQTTLEEANLVGNVYYGNYFIWQGRVRDLFMYAAIPDLLRAPTAEKGEIVCLETRMDYLREAMPFEKIRGVMYLQQLSKSGATLGFEFQRVEDDGSIEKLSVGHQRVAWVKRNPDGSPYTEPFPDRLRQAFNVGCH